MRHPVPSVGTEGRMRHRRRRRCCLFVHRRRAARSVLAALRETRKAGPPHVGRRDGNRVRAEPWGSGRDGSVEAFVLTASAAMVSGSISTGDPASTSPAVSPEL